MSQSPFDQFARAVKENVRNIDVDSLKKNAAKAGDAISKNAAQAGKVINKKADEIKDAASSAKKDIEDKVTELDRMLEKSITDYNEAYTLMNDKGMHLYVERCRSVDTITFIESLINSIANHPKSFDSDFEEIKVNRQSEIFMGLIENAFAPDFKSRLNNSVHLAQLTGVKEQDILKNVNDVDAFFLD